ncbi:MAG: hypothetical protein FJ086_14960 [Deltaproteobacteria bacterium]|nr:hypothetical protein [Deltaproteobacteria bacterium]
MERSSQLILTLCMLGLLAVIGGQTRLLRLRRALGLEQLLAGGFLFLPLGMVLSEAGLGLLDRDIVRHLDALVTLGLGVLGLLLGLQVDPDRLSGARRGLGVAAALETFTTLVLVAGPLYFALTSWDLCGRQDALAASALLGCVAAISSGHAYRAALRGEEQPEPEESDVSRVANAGTVLAVLSAGVLVAAFSPVKGLGAMEKVLAVFATGSVGGLSAWLLATETHDAALRTALLLGVILVTAGTAAHLAVPPVASTLLAGMVLANLPGTVARELRDAISFLEAPLTVLLTVIAGASLRAPSSWAAAGLLGAFLLLRTTGKLLGGRLAASATRAVPAGLGLGLLPSSAVAVGLALDFHLQLPDALVDVVLLVSVVGALLSETAGVWTTRLLARALPAVEPAPPAAADSSLSPGGPG